MRLFLFVCGIAACGSSPEPAVEEPCGQLVATSLLSEAQQASVSDRSCLALPERAGTEVVWLRWNGAEAGIGSLCAVTEGSETWLLHAAWTGEAGVPAQLSRECASGTDGLCAPSVREHPEASGLVEQVGRLVRSAEGGAVALCLPKDRYDKHLDWRQDVPRLKVGEGAGTSVEIEDLVLVDGFVDREMNARRLTVWKDSGGSTIAERLGLRLDELAPPSAEMRWTFRCTVEEGVATSCEVGGHEDLREHVKDTLVVPLAIADNESGVVEATIVVGPGGG